MFYDQHMKVNIIYKHKIEKFLVLLFYYVQPIYFLVCFVLSQNGLPNAAPQLFRYRQHQRHKSATVRRETMAPTYLSHLNDLPQIEFGVNWVQPLPLFIGNVWKNTEKSKSCWYQITFCVWFEIKTLKMHYSQTKCWNLWQCT